MSADNAIYIRPLKTGGYAVKCISSLYPEYGNEEGIDEEFKDAPVFATLDEAWEHEEKIQQEHEDSGFYIEYGSEVLMRKDGF